MKIPEQIKRIEATMDADHQRIIVACENNKDWPNNETTVKEKRMYSQWLDNVWERDFPELNEIFKQFKSDLLKRPLTEDAEPIGK